MVKRKNYIQDLNRAEYYIVQVGWNGLTNLFKNEEGGKFTHPIMNTTSCWDLITDFLHIGPHTKKNMLEDIRLLEVGAKRPLNGVRKCDGQTNRQTNKHRDISEYLQKQN